MLIVDKARPGVLVQKVLSLSCPSPHGQCGWSLGLDPLFCLSIENVIRENQWGGVDIRRGGVPVLRSNLICFGYSDGVVVGDEGKGLIEGNTIYGEAHVPGGTDLGSSPAREAGSPDSILSLWVLRKLQSSLGLKDVLKNRLISGHSHTVPLRIQEPLINHLVTHGIGETESFIPT